MSCFQHAKPFGFPRLGLSTCCLQWVFPPPIPHFLPSFLYPIILSLRLKLCPQEHSLDLALGLTALYSLCLCTFSFMILIQSLMFMSVSQSQGIPGRHTGSWLVHSYIPTVFYEDTAPKKIYGMEDAGRDPSVLLVLTRIKNKPRCWRWSGTMCFT